MSGAVFLAVLSLILAVPVAAQPLLADISRHVVELRHDFTGTDLLVFGAVEGAAAMPEMPDIVIVVEGPQEPVLVRRKARIAGIWVNQATAMIRRAPGYFALAATRPPEAVAATGPVWPDLAVEGVASAADADAFRAGFLRRMTAAGLYRAAGNGVRFVEGGLFRSEIRLPSNVPVGRYEVRILMYAEGALIAERRSSVMVDKSGFERAVFTLSRQQPLLYGLTAIAIVLLAGWLAGIMARR